MLLELKMIPDILACLILEEETGAPLFSHFFDSELKKDPSIVPQKLRAREIMLLHEMGKQVVYSVLVNRETSEARELLSKFAKKMEEVYPEGLKRGQGNFAHYVILENIVTSVFVDRE